MKQQHPKKRKMRTTGCEKRERERRASLHQEHNTPISLWLTRAGPGRKHLEPAFFSLLCCYDGEWARSFALRGVGVLAVSRIWSVVQNKIEKWVFVRLVVSYRETLILKRHRPPERSEFWKILLLFTLKFGQITKHCYQPFFDECRVTLRQISLQKSETIWKWILNSLR